MTMIRAALMICLTLAATPTVNCQTIPEMISAAYTELNTLRSALPEDIANQTDLEAQDELKALENQYFAGYAEDGEPPRAYTR